MPQTIKHLIRLSVFCTICMLSAYILTTNTHPSPLVTQWPENLQPGFYLVLNTDKTDPSLEINNQKNAKRTYFGPSQTIKESYKKFNKIKELHPGIHLNIIKVDDKTANPTI